jgi:sugar lactone lactonase YvrE
MVSTPYDLAGAPDGSLFVSQPFHNKIIVITARGEPVNCVGSGKAGFAGDSGHALGAELNSPYGIAVDRYGVLYIADHFNNRIRRVDLDGRVSTWAGSGLPGPPMSPGIRVGATQLALNRPRSVAVDASGVLYITSTDNHQVVRVTPDGGADLVAGTGTSGFSGDGDAAVAATLSGPYDVAVAVGGIVVADTNNRRIRYVGVDGRISTVAGTTMPGLAGPPSLSRSYVLPGSSGGADSVTRADQTDIGRVAAIEFSPRNALIVTDPSQHRILEITPDGLVRTLVGTGRAGASPDGVPAATASLDGPRGLTVGPDGSVYLAETGRHRIRVVTPAGILTTLTR